MKILQKKNLVFTPLLVAYAIISFFFSENILVADEGRYLNFSENILNGFYANPDLKPGFLWCGPGYPIILLLFTLLKAKLVYYIIIK